MLLLVCSIDDGVLAESEYVKTQSSGLDGKEEWRPKKRAEWKAVPQFLQNVANKKIGALTCVNYAADPFADLIKAFAYGITWIMKKWRENFFSDSKSLKSRLQLFSFFAF